MMTEGFIAIKALVWKDSKNITIYLAFCIVVTIWALLATFGSTVLSGKPAHNADSIIAYIPLLISSFSIMLMVSSLSEETTGQTLESLLCTPMDLREIFFSKILFIVVFPYVISLGIMVPVLASWGLPVFSLPVLYQIIVDLPLAMLVVVSATTVWLAIPGKNHWILPLFSSAGFVIALLFFNIGGDLFGFSGILPVSPVLTTILLVLCIALMYPMYKKIGTIEKCDVI